MHDLLFNLNEISFWTPFLVKLKLYKILSMNEIIFSLY